MRVAVTVGCTLTIRLSGCSSASALTKPRRPHLVARWVGGRRDWCGGAVLPTYCATKWGLRGFVKALALEHPDKRIVSVHPTVTATRMNDLQGMPPERVAEVVLAVARGDIAVEPGGDVDVRAYTDV